MSWRDSGITTPVLVLTARGSWHEKVKGINEGADDYVSKPFRVEEVLARLRALMRLRRRSHRFSLMCTPNDYETTSASAHA